MQKFYTLEAEYRTYNFDIDDIREIRIEIDPTTSLSPKDHTGFCRMILGFRKRREQIWGIKTNLREVISFLKELNEDGHMSDRALRKNLNMIRKYFEVGAKARLKELEEIERQKLEEMDKWAGPPMDIHHLIDEVMALHEISEGHTAV